MQPGASAAGSGVEATRLTPYLGFLFVLLSTATLFDGFDSAMMTIAAPEARQTLDISRGEWMVIFAINRCGMIASFVFLLFADRFGRRNLMMITVIGFTVFNGLTAFAVTKAEFTVFQFFSRLFLTAEYALAIIMVGEEFPARLRGRSIAILTSLATAGVMLIAKVQPYILLEPGAEGNLVHDMGAAIVSHIQVLLGRPTDGEDWRVLYVIGVVPLVLVMLLRFGMRETRRFEAERSARAATPRGWRAGLRAQVESAKLPWTRAYRYRTAIVVVLWNCVHLVTAPAVALWVIYAREDLKFTRAEIGDVLFWGYAGGFTGHWIAGYLIDRIGRKRTCAGFYMFAAVAIFMLFQTTTLQSQYLWMILTVLGFGAAGTATHVYASELFPTAIRATGYGWTTNLFGRATEVLVPLTAAVFVGTLGISWTVGAMALGPFVGALLVLRYAPETMGMTLEEVQESLAPSDASATVEPAPTEAVRPASAGR